MGIIHRGFIIKKDGHSKELTEKAKLFVYQPSSFNQSSQKHQEALKISTSLTCLSCPGNAMCCSWNYFYSPHWCTWSSFLVSSTPRLPQGHSSTSAKMFIGIPWGSHHLMHWDGVSLLFLSGAKWGRCPFIPLEKLRQITKTRIFLPEQGPCSETRVTDRNVQSFGARLEGKTPCMKNRWVRSHYRATKISRNQQ